MGKFSCICGVLNWHLKHKSRTDTRMQIYKTITDPKLVIGSLVLTKGQKNYIQPVETKSLRALKGCRIEDTARNVGIIADL